MAAGDLLYRQGSTWYTLWSGNNFPDGSYRFFRGVRIKVTKASTSFNTTCWLWKNVGSESSPSWQQVDYSGATTAAFTWDRVTSPNQIPQWRFMADRSIFSNPVFTIQVLDYRGTYDWPIYWYSYSTGLDTSNVAANYKTHAGTRITWDARRNMTH
jgi:hypothetical protein